MIFDTHVHYDDEAFDPDRDELLSSFPENGIGGFVNVCAEYDSIPGILSIVNKYKNGYAAIGIHPSDVEGLDDEKLGSMENLIKKDPKVVAVGEIGLDYHYEDPPREVQKKWFEAQLDMALRLGKPVVIHSRDAAEDTRFTLDRYKIGSTVGGVVHCFSYSAALALHYVRTGFYIGIGGVLTFKNGKKLKEVVNVIPLENIVLETDCPYLAPEPYRGGRNSSLYLPSVVRTIADIKGISEEEVERVTYENALKLYSIKS